MVSTIELSPRGKVTVATNEHTTPLPGLDDTGYAVLSSGSGNSFTPSVAHSGGKSGTGYWRVTGSGVNTAASNLRFGGSTEVTSGQTKRLGIWVRCSAAATVNPILRKFTDSSTEAWELGAPVVLVANTWTLLELQYAVAVNVVSVRPELAVQPGSTASGRTFDIDQVSLTTGTVTADFTGATPAAGIYTYAWLGDAGESASVQEVVDPDTTSAAIFALGAKLEWQQRTIVHDVPGASSPPVSLLPAGPRSGTLRFLFSERETARRAEIIHTRPGVITLTDADWPGSPMSYVAQGELVSELDPDTRRRWVVETGFSEVFL